MTHQEMHALDLSALLQELFKRIAEIGLKLRMFGGSITDQECVINPLQVDVTSVSSGTTQTFSGYVVNQKNNPATVTCELYTIGADGKTSSNPVATNTMTVNGTRWGPTTFNLAANTNYVLRASLTETGSTASSKLFFSTGS